VIAGGALARCGCGIGVAGAGAGEEEASCAEGAPSGVAGPDAIGGDEGTIAGRGGSIGEGEGPGVGALRSKSPAGGWTLVPVTRSGGGAGEV
jgi:hypothetical protein